MEKRHKSMDWDPTESRESFAQSALHQPSKNPPPEPAVWIQEWLHSNTRNLNILYWYLMTITWPFYIRPSVISSNVPRAAILLKTRKIDSWNSFCYPVTVLTILQTMNPLFPVYPTVYFHIQNKWKLSIYHSSILIFSDHPILKL